MRVGAVNRLNPPVWINLEYLTAEAYAERSHALPSPVQHGPAAGCRKWFFYPGFTPQTGGLLRETGLIERMTAFETKEAGSWLHSLGLPGAAPGQAASGGCQSARSLLRAHRLQQGRRLCLHPADRA